MPTVSPTAVHEPPPPRLSSGQTVGCTSDPISGRQSRPPPDPVLVDGEEEYEVEVVINSRMFVDGCSTSFNGRATAMNTTVGRMLRMYTPELVTEFTPLIPELHAKYVELILTTYLSNPLKTVVPGRHSLEGGDVRDRPFPTPTPSRSSNSGHGCTTPTPSRTCNSGRGCATPTPSTDHLLIVSLLRSLSLPTVQSFLTYTNIHSCHP